MRSIRPVGRTASSAKYDLLTALGAYACQGDKHLQRLTLRFITLIVARYNWQADEISVGQREIARLWGVDERTVKREIAKLRALGWLVQRRAALRGRVAIHGLDLAAILTMTESAWHAVGPDFSARMGQGRGDAPAVGNVVAFRSQAPIDLPQGASVWMRAQARLQAENPSLFNAWFQQLGDAGQGAGVLELVAPSRFHATFVATHHLAQVLAAVQKEDGAVRNVTVSAG